MKKNLLAIFLAGCGSWVQAQYYEQAIGLRLGGTSGITLKKHFTEFRSGELLLSGRNGGMQLTGLMELSKPLNISENLFLVYGYGPHIGYEKLWPYHRGVQGLNTVNHIYGPLGPIPENFNSKNYFAFGFDGIIGLEYRFGAPFTLGLDIKPYLNFLGFRYTRVRFGDVAISTRFTF